MELCTDGLTLRHTDTQTERPDCLMLPTAISWHKHNYPLLAVILISDTADYDFLITQPEEINAQLFV